MWTCLLFIASLVAQLVKNLPIMQETQVGFLGWEDPWRRNRLPTPVFLSLPGGSVGKESACNAGDLASIPGWERSPGGGHGNPLQYSCLENPMDRGAWWATVRGVTRVGHDWSNLAAAAAIFYQNFIIVCNLLLWAFPVALVVKNPPANAGDIRVSGSIPQSGRSPGGGHGNPLQYPCLENPMDGGVWQATVHGVRRRQTWPNDSTHTHGWFTMLC